MLNIENSLVVIIDAQVKLAAATKYGLETVINTAKLAKAANILSVPIVVTEQYPAGLGHTVAEVKNELTEDNFITEKTSFCAADEAEFADKIKNSGKKQIVICGIETHICVLQTAVELLNQGFEVYVVKNCCASRKKEDYKCGLELLKQYGAKITNLEITLFEWLKTSKHPNFKEIQALIK